MDAPFETALTNAYELAHAALAPETHERLNAALTLAQRGGLRQSPDGETWTVPSQSTPGHTYSVNGSCGCDWKHYHTAERCTHQLAVLLHRKALKLLHEGAAAVTVEPDAGPPVAGVDPRYLVFIKNKPFIRYPGLLQMAYAQGLCKLETTFTSVTSELALAQCTATFTDGRVVTDVADSTPANVAPHVRPHWPRMAATRAAARALRNALALDMCSLEELAESGVDHG